MACLHMFFHNLPISLSPVGLQPQTENIVRSDNDLCTLTQADNPGNFSGDKRVCWEKAVNCSKKPKTSKKCLIKQEILNEAMKIKKEDDFIENEHSEINLYVNFNV